MATLEEGIEFTGSIGKLSAYRMKGSDKIILRKKAGPTKKQLLTGKNFERTRENMAEFPGVGLAVSAIRHALAHVGQLSDHNYTSTLTSICKQIQVLDPVADRGQRSILLSQHRYMLAGFRLHLKYPFQAIVTGPVNCTIKRKTKTAIIELPRLLQGINLHLPWKQPLYRFTMSLGVVQDIIYEKGYYDSCIAGQARSNLDTAWHVAAEPFQTQTVELKLDMPGAIKGSQTLIFAIGIEMGVPGPYGVIEVVKYAGAACILAVG